MANETELKLQLPPTLADFEFRVGNNNQSGDWSGAPLPASITRRSGAGTGGSDRVTLTWADGAIINTWLEVRVKATPATGLVNDNVFYFGNAIGETGVAEHFAQECIA